MTPKESLLALRHAIADGAPKSCAGKLNVCRLCNARVGPRVLEERRAHIAHDSGRWQMPLTQEQIRDRRTQSAEVSRDQDVMRIADALELIADALGDIRDLLRTGSS